MLTIIVNHGAVSALKERSSGFRKLVDGTPVVVVEEGHVFEDRVRGLRMMKEDLLMAVRRNGLQSLEEVQWGIVERDGSYMIVVRK